MKLVIGKVVKEGIEPVRESDDALIGRDVSWGLLGLLRGRKPRSRLGFGLFLENDQEAPAQYVRVNLYAREVPTPLMFSVIPNLSKYEVVTTTIPDERAVLLQFRDDLVIYPGTGAYLGVVYIDWLKGIHPDKIVLEARIYSFKTIPTTYTISRPISWQ